MRKLRVKVLLKFWVREREVLLKFEQGKIKFKSGSVVQIKRGNDIELGWKICQNLDLNIY